jgi:CheY-like chemotaxis protein
MSAAKASASALVGPNEAATLQHAEARLGVAIVDDDVPAGKRALHALEGVTHQSDGNIALHPKPPLAAAASPAPARSAHHILLVEDESTVLEFSTTVLVRGGYQVTAVEGCEAAWEAIQSGSYDLLVTDNQMPGMSGLELAGKLRFAQISLPIIMASGGIEAEELTQNQTLQPAIALPKPFTAKQLLETVAEALRRTGREPAHTEVSFPASGDAHSRWGLNE